ncbi:MULTISPECIES: Pr6Pr family membrane protein [unclassified Agreia]|uniref:Pr6Pr family membrane protein n=1 Tax=unclassified Agreia TaxID=2641148 RepID=UPI000ACECDCA|nr:MULTISPECIES: Pr6Pr family membrane protein [unclassified Agreia]
MSRRLVGAVRLLAGIGLLVTIVIQINDRVVNNAFDPWEYFSYFTIETSLMNIVVFIVGGILAFRLSRDTELFTTVRMATLTYAIITAGVYNLLLRNVPYNGFQGLSWPNEVIHVWIPILIVLDWLISPGRPALSWKALRVVMIYPLLWLAYSLVRGAVSNGIYPYPFLDPATAGWGSVIAYIVALSLVLLGLAALAIVYSRRVGREAIRRQS